MDALDAAGWPTEEQVISRRGRKAEQTEVRRRSTQPMARARVRVAIVVPDERSLDWDNAVASLKPCFDGCVLAGVVVDDSIARLPERTVGIVLRRGLSQVIMEFVELTEDTLGL